MYLQSVFELSKVLDSEKFSKIFSKLYDVEHTGDNEYVDYSRVSKGITITYRDSSYKKKITLSVRPEVILKGDRPDKDNIPKLIHKLEKRISEYFGSRYTLDDFTLSQMTMIADIDVRNRENAGTYIKVLQRVGKVKGFSPPRRNWLGDDISFCLDGNSNGIEFMIYDLEQLLKIEQDFKHNELKAIPKKAIGLLRTEVRLTEPKAFRKYTDETTTSAQIADLSAKGQDVFLDTFTKIVPFGDFYKKDKAAETIRREVSDKALRRRMLRLIGLVPEKKSLLLAQKALNYRSIDDVMEAFAVIDLSPVTLSKRHETKKLDNLYKYM